MPTNSVMQHPDLAELAKYKVFDNIIPIANNDPEPVSSSADFSKASITGGRTRGYRDAAIALANPPQAAADLKRAIARLV